MKPFAVLRSLLVAALVVCAILVAIPQAEAGTVVVRRGVGFRQRVVVRQPAQVVVGPRNAAAIIAPQAVVVPSSPSIVVPSQQLIVPQQQLLIVR